MPTYVRPVTLTLSVYSLLGITAPVPFSNSNSTSSVFRQHYFKLPQTLKCNALPIVTNIHWSRRVSCYISYNKKELAHRPVIIPLYEMYGPRRHASTAISCRIAVWMWTSPELRFSSSVRVNWSTRLRPQWEHFYRATLCLSGTYCSQVSLSHKPVLHRNG